LDNQVCSNVQAFAVARHTAIVTNARVKNEEGDNEGEGQRKGEDKVEIS
jgi:hypothetical protein